STASVPESVRWRTWRSARGPSRWCTSGTWRTGTTSGSAGTRRNGSSSETKKPTAGSIATDATPGGSPRCDRNWGQLPFSRSKKWELSLFFLFFAGQQEPLIEERRHGSTQDRPHPVDPGILQAARGQRDPQVSGRVH